MKSIKQFNKKGNLLSIWWFFVLAIVGAGIVAGTLIFYGADTDVRKLEADILSDRIVTCVTSEGILNADFIAGNFDIFSKCGLFEDLLSKKSKYMIKIQKIDSSGNTNELFKFGEDMEVNCEIKANILMASKFPYCSTKKLELPDSSGNLVKLKIITGSSYEKGDLYAK